MSPRQVGVGVEIELRRAPLDLAEQQVLDRVEAHGAQVQREIDQIVEAVCEGLFHASMKEKLTSLEERKAALLGQLQQPEEVPIALHPGLAEVYRRKVAELTTALNVEGTKTEAAGLLRSLLSGIRLVPGGHRPCDRAHGNRPVCLLCRGVAAVR